MNTYKEYRLTNENEKDFHDKFKNEYENNPVLSAIIFGWKNSSQTIPNQYLTEQEENICLSLIQWLGSPVGRCFLEELGYKKSIKKNEDYI